MLGFFVFGLQVLLFFQVQWFFAPPPASSVVRLLFRGLAVVEVPAGWAHPLWVCLAGSAHPRDGAESRRGSVVGGRPSVAGPRGREIVPSPCRGEAVDRRARVAAGLHPGVAGLHPGVAARRRALGVPPPSWRSCPCWCSSSIATGALGLPLLLRRPFHLRRLFHLPGALVVLSAGAGCRGRLLSP